NGQVQDLSLRLLVYDYLCGLDLASFSISNYLFPTVGSSALRKPSPKTLKPKTTSINATPGKIITCGSVRTFLRLSCSIEPHSAMGGLTPRPRKLSAAVVIIASGISRLICTM